jgi:pimeloyl-ACP methyl ester carboxylesterase
MPDLDSSGGRLLPVHGTRLYVVEHGSPSAFPLICLHGGPGDDADGFGNHLDVLTLDGRYRLVLVDAREQGRSDRGTNPETWTRHQLASDVSAVAAGLGVDDYAVLGHAAAAVVALQHAVDAHGAAAATILSFPPVGDGGMAALTPRLTEVPQPVLVVGPDSPRIAELLPRGESAGLDAPFTADAGVYCDVVRDFLDRAVVV